MPFGAFAVTSAKYVSSASLLCGCPGSTWPVNVTTPNSWRNKTKLPLTDAAGLSGELVRSHQHI